MDEGHQKSKQTSTLKKKKLRKCRDELVKKVWGQGRNVVCSRTTTIMSNIHKPHLHTYPYTCGAWSVLNCECTQTEVQYNKLYTTCREMCAGVACGCWT